MQRVRALPEALLAAEYLEPAAARRIVGDLGPAHRAPAVGHPQAVAPAQTQHADGMLRLLFAEQIASGSRVQIGGIK